MDLKSLPDSYVMEFDMPGFEVGNIKVQVEDGSTLHISGERRWVFEEGVYIVYNGRAFGKFARAYHLPRDANPEKIVVVYKDGVLIVTMGKLPLELKKSRKGIRIKVMSSPVKE